MTTINWSVRLRVPRDTALRELGPSQAAMIRGCMIIGMAEVWSASRVEPTTMKADLQHVVRAHLPQPLHRRLEAVQHAMRTPSPRRTTADDAQDVFCSVREIGDSVKTFAQHFDHAD